MLRILIIFFILNFYNSALSSSKDSIISKLEQTNVLSFKFVQMVNKKNEKGFCIIKYPKKIYCEYENIIGKVIVADGKFLVIKNRNKGSYYVYPLKRTPLELILDKKYIIKNLKV